MGYGRYLKIRNKPGQLKRVANMVSQKKSLLVREAFLRMVREMVFSRKVRESREELLQWRGDLLLRVLSKRQINTCLVSLPRTTTDQKHRALKAFNNNRQVFTQRQIEK